MSYALPRELFTLVLYMIAINQWLWCTWNRRLQHTEYIFCSLSRRQSTFQVDLAIKRCVGYIKYTTFWNCYSTFWLMFFIKSSTVNTHPHLIRFLNASGPKASLYTPDVCTLQSHYMQPTHMLTIIRSSKVALQVESVKVTLSHTSSFLSPSTTRGGAPSGSTRLIQKLMILVIWFSILASSAQAFQRYTF